MANVCVCVCACVHVCMRVCMHACVCVLDLGIQLPVLIPSQILGSVHQHELLQSHSKPHFLAPILLEEGCHRLKLGICWFAMIPSCASEMPVVSWAGSAETGWVPAENLHWQRGNQGTTQHSDALTVILLCMQPISSYRSISSHWGCKGI